MTPGLAGFVVAGDEPHWAGTLDSVQAALAESFGIAPEPAGPPGGARRRTWLDTFDWRLYRAGLLLEYVTANRAGQLVLTSAGAGAAGRAEHIAQPVTGWRTGQPCLFDQLPDGPVTDRIARVIAPRALLPLVTVTSTATVARLLNQDGKTVARLVIERPVIAGAAARGADKICLPPRLSIAEVRGYPGQARRAARIVEQTVQVEAGSPGSSPGKALLDDALAALGSRAGDYSTKVDAKITADMPAARAVATILLTLLDAVEVNVTGVLRDTDTEFLHDLRVAVRRTRAALKLLGEALGLPGEALDRFAAEFKWLGDVTTPVRDLDVHLLDFTDMAAGLKAAKADDLGPFRDFLAQRRAREFRALVRALRSARFAQLTADWRVTLTTITDGKPRRPGKPGRGAAKRAAPGRSVPMAASVLSAGALAIDRTRVAFRKVARKGGAITGDSPAESLHDLRKRAKELRYALEFFAPLHDKLAYAAVLGDLKRLQDCLGEFQDTEVQIEEIRALAEAMLSAQAASQGAITRTVLAMGEITAGLASRQEAARDAFEDRFTGFADADGQRRMAALLRSPGEGNGVSPRTPRGGGSAERSLVSSRAGGKA
jgi:CHAD domain-containing protein